MTELLHTMRPAMQELNATGRKSSQLCYQFTGGKCTRPDCGFSHDRDAPKRGVTVRAASVEICFDYSRSVAVSRRRSDQTPAHLSAMLC